MPQTKKSEDRFWFDVFHEIGHILKHGKKDCFVDFQNGVTNDEKEREANLFAEKCLIADFEKIKRILHEKEDIITVAKDIKRSPAVLAGRVAHEEEKNDDNIYGKLSEFFRSKVEYCNVSPSMMLY